MQKNPIFLSILFESLSNAGLFGELQSTSNHDHQQRLADLTRGITEYQKKQQQREQQQGKERQKEEGKEQNQQNRFKQSNSEKYPHNTKILWSEGSSNIIDYRNSTTKPRNQPKTLLLIPSLINKPYIFDLSPQNSMINFLTKQGHHCLLMDWGEPSNNENNFKLEHYIQRLNRAIQAIRTPISLIGYCMGGLIAMASTIENKRVESLALIATPWNFNQYNKNHNNFINEQYLTNLFEMEDIVPAHIVYSLMYFIDPVSINNKFINFCKLAPQKMQEFIERESWIQDSIPISSQIAKECFIDFAIHNHTMQQKWIVNNKAINPKDINVPCFNAIALNDKIIPPKCSEPLQKIINNCTTHYFHSGHISMIAGKNAHNNLWKNLDYFFCH